MKNITKRMAFAGLTISAAAMAAAPASAQVNGIATADISLAVAGSQALQQGYQQINTTYQSQLTQVQQLQQQRQELLQPLDTNSDGQLSEAEGNAAPEATVQQVQQLQQQIAQTQAPVQMARLYVVNQIAQQYSPAVQQVISDRGIQLMLTPDAITYGFESADVTQAVTEQLNTRTPSVGITPPEGWQPNQQTVQLAQQVEQVLRLAAMQQAQAQQQGQQQQGQQQVQGR
jgi:Skp family chaperone for outer membrane proteins